MVIHDLMVAVVLWEGEYSNCTISVTDVAGNVSAPLSITAFRIDTTEPVVLDVNAVATPSGNTTPSYTFTTSEAGSIIYGGCCESATSEVIMGNNTVVFYELEYGTHSNCTIAVIDTAGNVSAPLAVTEFVINSSANDFVILIEVKGNSLTFTIPTLGEGYNYNVDCNNDGINIVTGQTGDYVCNYGVEGTYTIRIQGNSAEGTGFSRIYFNNSGDYDKLLSIEQWGASKWTSMEGAFYGASRMVVNASDTPDLSKVASMSSMFERAHAFNQDIGSWDASSVSGMFRNAKFNQDIGNWDTSSVTSMWGMFRFSLAFNQDIGRWNVTSLLYADRIISGTPLSSQNYDLLLTGWGAQILNNNVIFDGGAATYCEGATARDSMVVTYNWVITDGGILCSQ